MIKRRYSELKNIKTFEERYEYLKIGGQVGAETFGYDRYLNQMLYNSKEWKAARRDVIVRDNGCDLGIEGLEIHDTIAVHHMNPISPEDIIEGNPEIFNPEFLISTKARTTHKAVHFGDSRLLDKGPVTRTKHDTTPWR